MSVPAVKGTISERALAAMRPVPPADVPSVEPWLIIKAEPRQEMTAEAYLARSGFEVYVPRRKVLVMPPRNRLSQRQRRAYFSMGKMEMRPWLPGYCFARAAVATLSLRDLHTLKGVSGAVYFGESLAKISASAVAAIRRREVDGTLDVHSSVTPFRFEVGEQVRMTDGLLSGHNATVERIEDNQEIAHMLANLFGRQTRVSLHVSQIEKL